jgi:hypothetical protein
VNRLPREARDGIMRAWLEILRERHPGTAWIAVGEGAAKDDSPMNVGRETAGAQSAG